MKRKHRSPFRAVWDGAKEILRWLFKPKTLILNSDFSRMVIRHYCAGRGCEIGPGVTPRTNRRTTFRLDLDTSYAGACPISIDVRADAAHLPFANESLSHIVSSHVLEHCQNTLAVLRECLRVLKPQGTIVLLLPHKERTFDRDRPVTSLAHHIEDERRGVGSEDRSHVQEFASCAIEKFDHWWKETARLPDGTFDWDFLIRHGHVHHHVWTQTEMVDILRYLGCAVLFVLDRSLDRADSFLIVAQRPNGTDRNHPA